MENNFYQWLQDFKKDVPHRAPTNEYPLEYIPNEFGVQSKVNQTEVKKVNYPSLGAIMELFKNTLKKYETK